MTQNKVVLAHKSYLLPSYNPLAQTQAAFVWFAITFHAYSLVTVVLKSADFPPSSFPIIAKFLLSHQCLQYIR